MTSAGITFMRANPPTKGHFLIVEELHNLDTDKKYIYLSHSHDSRKNPLPYEEKYSFFKTFVDEKYSDVEVVYSNARSIIEALHELYEKGFDEITVALGSDRIEDFRRLINLYNGKPSKSTGVMPFEFSKVDFIQAGNIRDEDADDLSSMSATKQRRLAAEGNYEEFAKGVPTEDESLKKELYNSLRKGMKITEALFGKPVEVYYEVGPIIKAWWKKDPNGILGFLGKDPWKYDVQWWPAEPELFNRIYHLTDLDSKVRRNIVDIDTINAEFKKTGKYDEVLYSTVKVIYKNEKAYKKYNEDIIEFLETFTEPDDGYEESSYIKKLPTREELEKEGFPDIRAIEI